MSKIKLSFLLFVSFLIIFTGCKDDGNNPVVDSSNIKLVATYSTNASTNGVYVTTVNFKNYAFIADGTNGLQIIDVTYMINPDSVSSVQTGGSANDVFVAAINGITYAFVSDFNTGLVIVNVSDVFNPQILGTISGIYTNTSFIDAANKIAYIGTGGGAVSIIDLSNLPNSTTLLSTTGSNCNGIYVSANLLYIAGGNFGFSIYDVSNPALPVLKSNTNTTGSANNMVVIQNNAYVADSYNGTLIFNVSNPLSPTLLSRIAPNGQILGVSVNNNTLYCADNNYGVESINISNPSSPSQNGYIKLNSSANNIFYFGGYLFLAAAEGGLAILQPAN